jgi:hypothetical protein
MTKRTVYFVMVLHPLGTWFRAGPAYASREKAKEWVPLVRGRYRVCRVRVMSFTARFNADGTMTKKSTQTLDKKFNMDPPGSAP